MRELCRGAAAAVVAGLLLTGGALAQTAEPPAAAASPPAESGSPAPVSATGGRIEAGAQRVAHTLVIAAGDAWAASKAALAAGAATLHEREAARARLRNDSSSEENTAITTSAGKSD